MGEAKRRRKAVGDLIDPGGREERLIRVEAPHFTAALVIVDGRCIKAPPILHWALGKGEGWLKAYFAQKGWEIEEGLQ
ncbi:hypothetical protein NKG99_20530 [Mesorhizobium sp. M1409]|uniref:hypothetical protein n=1 Tax=Mesorhizobium sp. M1409 TaxID=2957100 RepID=UPI00333C76C7